MMQAYGFFACSDTDTQINFIMPSTTQYIHIYAEIDLTVAPNRFEVNATPMSNTQEWSARQMTSKLFQTASINSRYGKCGLPHQQ